MPMIIKKQKQSVQRQGLNGGGEDTKQSKANIIVFARLGEGVG